MKNRNYVLLLLVFLSVCPIVAFGQLNRSPEFREKYALKEVVVLSRHNIRSPLSDNGSALGKLTPHAWTQWSAASSELTLRGGILETMMGQFFRKWLVSEGMFVENYVPSTDEVNFYANSMQRTIATAQYFSSGFMPVAGLSVMHRYTPSTMDPVFFPRLTKVSDGFCQEAMRQISEMGGKEGLKGINAELEDSYRIISEVLDLKDSPACKAGEIHAFNDDETRIIFKKGEEPAMKGGLKLANSASDAFILQYYEEPDAKKAAFGHDITLADWEKIARIKDVYGDILFTAPIVACNVAHPLLVYINDELNSAKRKFTFLCGHDSNIASVTAALGVEEYELPNSIEKKTPIGCKLIFEKWIDKDNHEFVSVNIVYQTTDQLRNLNVIDLNNPPMVYPLKLKNLDANPDGLYTFDAISQRFEEAIRAYDEIK